MPREEEAFVIFGLDCFVYGLAGYRVHSLSLFPVASGWCICDFSEAVVICKYDGARGRPCLGEVVFVCLVDPRS